MFLIAINDITINKKKKKKLVLYSLFADDINILYRSKKQKTVQIFLQNTINQQSKWSNETGFTFSHKKSQAIFFTKKKKTDRTIKLKILENQIRNKKRGKNTWRIFDEKMKWYPI
jgi:hypothetical protein